MANTPQVSDQTAARARLAGPLCAAFIVTGFFLFLVLLIFFPDLSMSPMSSFGGLSLIYLCAAVQLLIVVVSVLIFSWLKAER